jgi:organic hydroperoxide reductase OsmC/OhrA
MTTFLAVAEVSKLPFRSFDCTARGILANVEGSGYQMTEIKLYPRVEVTAARDVERAARIIEEARRDCLISNSIKTEVIVEPTVFATKDDLPRAFAQLDTDPLASRAVNRGQ